METTAEDQVVVGQPGRRVCAPGGGITPAVARTFLSASARGALGDTTEEQTELAASVLRRMAGLGELERLGDDKFRRAEGVGPGGRWPEMPDWDELLAGIPEPGAPGGDVSDEQSFHCPAPKDDSPLLVGQTELPTGPVAECGDFDSAFARAG